VSGEDWIGDHLLGEESESDAEQARRRLAEDPALRERVQRLAEVAGRLDELSPAAWEVAVPPAGEERVADTGAPATSPAPAPAASSATGPARRRRIGAPALAAALAVVALAVGVGIGALIWSGGGSGTPSARTVVLRPLPGSASAASGSAQVTSGGRLVLRVRRLPASGAGRYYEAWLMTDATHLVPVAAFTVRGSGSARVTVPLPAPAARYRYFDVSLQQVSGGAAHSGDSVLRGPTGG
jgi:hypothetical protein